MRIVPIQEATASIASDIGNADIDISGAADDLGQLLCDRQPPVDGETIERERK